jgi:hypothetical protein
MFTIDNNANAKQIARNPIVNRIRSFMCGPLNRHPFYTQDEA